LRRLNFQRVALKATLNVLRVTKLVSTFFFGALLGYSGRRELDQKIIFFETSE